MLMIEKDPDFIPNPLNVFSSDIHQLKTSMHVITLEQGEGSFLWM